MLKIRRFTVLDSASSINLTCDFEHSFFPPEASILFFFASGQVILRKKIPSLQNQYSELAENFQAYSIQKDVKFRKISAIKAKAAPFVNFPNFPFFLLRFWTACLILMHQDPNAPKQYSKIYFRCKISRSIEYRRQNWPLILNTGFANFEFLTQNYTRALKLQFSLQSSKNANLLPQRRKTRFHTLSGDRSSEGW